MRKKYPSQIRYEAENPTITFRVKIEDKKKIENMAYSSGKSLSELVRYALLGLEKDFSSSNERQYEAGKENGKSIGFKDGYDKGYTKGMNDWAIGIPCFKCNYKKLLYIKPNSPDHQKTIEEMRGRLCHDICL